MHVIFRFAAFGAGDTTSLRIYREDYANRKDDDDGDDDDDDDRYPSVGKYIFAPNYVQD